MRIAIGSVFFNAGVLKYQSWEITLLLFRDEYKVPLFDPTLMARMATFNELTFSTLLFLGLATRIATLPFLGMIVVIQTFVYPNVELDALPPRVLFVGGGYISFEFGHVAARAGVLAEE